MDTNKGDSHATIDSNARIDAPSSSAADHDLDSLAPPPLWAMIVGLAVFLTTGAAAIAVYAHTARTATDRDPFIYGQIGKEIVAGKLLYSEAWIDKPPVGMLMYAIPQLVEPRSYRAIVVFCAMTIVAQAFLLAYAFRRSLAAAAACALFVMLYPLELGTFTWPSTEHFANLFVTGCLVVALAVTRARSYSTVQCVTAGALAMAAFHVRQNTVLCGLLPFLAVMLAGRSWRDRAIAGAWMIAGGIAAWGVVIAIVLWLGDLHGYFWALFVYPRIFASQGSAGDMFELVQYFARTSLPLIVGIFGLLAAHGRYLPLTLAAIVIGVGGCLLTFHNHEHYLANVLPYVALVIGIGTQRLAQFGPGLPWFSVAAMAIMVIPSVVGRVKIVTMAPTHVPLERVAAETDRLAPENATLWVCGPLTSEAIQFASRLPAANALCWSFQMQSPWKDLLPKPWETILAEYLDHPPDVLVVEESIAEEAQDTPSPVVAPEYLQLLRLLLAQNHYHVAASVEGYTILLRAR